MSPLANVVPLAFEPASLFLLFVIFVVGGLAFLVYAVVGGALRHRRMESGSEMEMIEGDDSPRRRPEHTRVSDSAPVAGAGTDARSREPRMGPGDD